MGCLGTLVCCGCGDCVWPELYGFRDGMTDAVGALRRYCEKMGLDDCRSCAGGGVGAVLEDDEVVVAEDGLELEAGASAGRMGGAAAGGGGGGGSSLRSAMRLDVLRSGAGRGAATGGADMGAGCCCGVAARDGCGSNLTAAAMPCGCCTVVRSPMPTPCGGGAGWMGPLKGPL